MKPTNVEDIKPYDIDEDKTGQVRMMFDSIAPAYDFMNRAMTFGIDIVWRKKAVNMLKRYNPEYILDVATGTGDFAIKLYNILKPTAITGVDLSQGMLNVAKAKVAKEGLSANITFQEADCLDMSFSNETFNAVTVAYGVRNFEHLDRGYAEMFRVLKTGGVLCVIELSTPTNRLIKWFYDIYTHYLIPFVGRLVSRDTRAYSYLPDSIAAVAQGNDMVEIMKTAGFKNCSFRRLTFGTCTIYIGEKL